MLIEGEILELPGPNPPHATITTKVDSTLRRSSHEAMSFATSRHLYWGVRRTLNRMSLLCGAS
jgi:hypothetical protein